MAANINETNQVEEQPATYNRNFQLMLIGALVFVVIVMVYASLFRSSPADRQIEDQVKRELGKQALSSPEQEFREQIKNQERRLQKQREEDLSEQKDYIDEKGRPIAAEQRTGLAGITRWRQINARILG